MNFRRNRFRNVYTTQIDHYNNYSVIFDCLKRINTVLIDLCQDMWSYISHNYFKLKIKEEEVGSSTMPHKVNPINFENAEGNLMLSNNLFDFMSSKLPRSRLQATDLYKKFRSCFFSFVNRYKSFIKGLAIDIKNN